VSSAETSRLLFREEVERGFMTHRGCRGGGGSPTGSSSLGETDRDERAEVVISNTHGVCALVLSSCSSSASRLGEIIRERFILISHDDRF